MKCYERIELREGRVVVYCELPEGHKGPCKAPQIWLDHYKKPEPKQTQISL